jgi:hypothetical protein
MVEEQEQKRKVLPEESSSEQAVADLKKILEEVAREIASLDLLRRALLIGVIRQQSGMGVEDWLQAAESLANLMQALDQPGRVEDIDRRRQIITMLAEWKGKLERLASCFQMAARLTSNYVKDPGELAGSLEALAQREKVVRRLISEIEQIEGSSAKGV